MPAAPCARKSVQKVSVAFGMFGRFKLTGKIVVAVLGTLLVTSAISFWITQRQVNQQQEEAFRDRLRQVTGMASTTRAWFSDNIDQMVLDHNFKHSTQVPVVVAWNVAQKYADAHNMSFRTPSLAPRDPKNHDEDLEQLALQ